MNPRWDETVIAHSDNYASLSSSAFICWFSSSSYSRHSRDDVQCISNVLDGWPDLSRAVAERAADVFFRFQSLPYSIFPSIFGGAEGFPPFYLVVVVVIGRPVRREETKATMREWLRKFHQTRLKNGIIRKEETTEIRRVHHRHLLKKNTADANHHKEISRRSSTRDFFDFSSKLAKFKRNYFLDGVFSDFVVVVAGCFAGRAERE